MRRRPEPGIWVQTQLLFVPKANQTITTQHTKLSCNIKNGEVKKYLWQHLFWCLFSFCYVVILKYDTKNLSRNIKKCNKSLKYGLIWAMETIYGNTLLFLHINGPVNFRLWASQRFIRRRLEPKEQKEKKLAHIIKLYRKQGKFRSSIDYSLWKSACCHLLLIVNLASAQLSSAPANIHSSKPSRVTEEKQPERGRTWEFTSQHLTALTSIRGSVGRYSPDREEATYPCMACSAWGS